MKVSRNGGTLNITELSELSARNYQAFEDEVGAFLSSHLEQIRIDFSDTVFVDCRGVGALLSVLTRACGNNSNPSLNCIRPTSHVRRLFRLAGLDHGCSVQQGNTQSGTQQYPGRRTEAPGPRAEEIDLGPFPLSQPEALHRQATNPAAGRP